MLAFTDDGANLERSNLAEAAFDGRRDPSLLCFPFASRHGRVGGRELSFERDALAHERSDVASLLAFGSDLLRPKPLDAEAGGSDIRAAAFRVGARANDVELGDETAAAELPHAPVIVLGLACRCERCPQLVRRLGKRRTCGLSRQHKGLLFGGDLGLDGRNLRAQRGESGTLLARFETLTVRRDLEEDIAAMNLATERQVRRDDASTHGGRHRIHAFDFEACRRAGLVHRNPSEQKPTGPDRDHHSHRDEAKDRWIHPVGLEGTNGAIE